MDVLLVRALVPGMLPTLQLYTTSLNSETGCALSASLPKKFGNVLSASFSSLYHKRTRLRLMRCTRRDVSTCGSMLSVTEKQMIESGSIDFISLVMHVCVCVFSVAKDAECRVFIAKLADIVDGRACALLSCLDGPISVATDDDVDLKAVVKQLQTAVECQHTEITRMLAAAKCSIDSLDVGMRFNRMYEQLLSSSPDTCTVQQAFQDNDVYDDGIFTFETHNNDSNVTTGVYTRMPNEITHLCDLTHVRNVPIARAYNNSYKTPVAPTEWIHEHVYGGHPTGYILYAPQTETSEVAPEDGPGASETGSSEVASEVAPEDGPGASETGSSEVAPEEGSGASDPDASEDDFGCIFVMDPGDEC